MSQQSHPSPNFSSLLPPSWKSIITEWLKEDIPSFDFGGFVVGEKPERAILYCKATGVLAGVPFFEEIFTQLNCTVEWKLPEGSLIEVATNSEDKKKNRVEVAYVRGKVKDILLGERTALNLLARASGIASRSHHFSSLGKSKGFKGKIAGTRKTTPGFRFVEKYALLVGGADTHRFDLSSMIMIKDNHVEANGSIKRAVEMAKSVGGFTQKVEVECQNQAEAEEAIEAGADIVMLDNFKPDLAKEVAGKLKTKYKNQHHFLIDISGGITEENISGYFSDAVDVISLGCLTQSVPHIDFSLKIVK
eukprot:TRINITY_DN5695_c0_g1_i1.p1 TRINITY_DN5695_c0_g1~~TRINITY_DN5695_c0_g1_i1.p1  ORF type:complete len:305 (-),score=92.87 TRINITY_DN5695_c0_g1_i1:52-966(-)